MFFFSFETAIRFVLSDAYTSMSREERQALLHESAASTSQTVSAWVEIVFDNTDGRFPSNSGSRDLVLRRTIGIKKDEYAIDGRSASKSDVMNLLEAAGFSRSNPYYIVPQGRVSLQTKRSWYACHSDSVPDAIVPIYASLDYAPHHHEGQ